MRKRELYGRLGIGEYWRFDSTGGQFYGEPLVGEVLVGGEYRRLEMRRNDVGLVWGRSDTLGLDLCWDNGRLRLYDPARAEYIRNTREWGGAYQTSESRANAEAEARRRAEAQAAAEAEGRRRAEAQAASAESRATAEAEARRRAEDRIRQLEDELRRRE